MSHYPAGAWPQPTNGYRTFGVDYTITGSETNGGLDFNIPIGQLMADDTYKVVPAAAGGTSGSDGQQASAVEILDIPKSGRGLGQFRIVLGAALSPGDVLEFLVTGTVA